MRSLRIMLAATAVATLLSACGPTPTAQTPANATAEPPIASMKDFGDYEVHFNAISTDQLQPEIARTYNITRSKNRALLNVSILEKQPGKPAQPVAADVTVNANNLTGQMKDLKIRQIREGDAIYYIGDVAVADGETLVFDIHATPKNGSSRFSVRFSRQFFSN